MIKFNCLSLNVGIENKKANEQEKVRDKKRFETKEDQKRSFYLEKIHRLKPEVICLQEQKKKDEKEINSKMTEDQIPKDEKEKSSQMKA